MDHDKEIDGVLRHLDGKLAIIIPRADIKIDFAEFDVEARTLYLTVHGEKEPRRVGCYDGAHELALQRVTSILVAHLPVRPDGSIDRAAACEYDIPLARR